jgi:hypothetical protein
MNHWKNVNIEDLVALFIVISPIAQWVSNDYLQGKLATYYVWKARRMLRKRDETLSYFKEQITNDKTSRPKD